MKPKVIIRRAREADLPALQLLLQQLFSIEQDFKPDATRQERGLRLLIFSQQGAIFVAEVAGKVVGMATIQILISTAEGAQVGLVEDVVVDEQLRGQGIGRMLLAGLEDWANTNGLARLQLLADSSNHPALNFYADQGWSSTSLVALRKFPTTVD
jgi:ribosomal protein S18 acetylase RimI-like enzyme